MRGSGNLCGLSAVGLAAVLAFVAVGDAQQPALDFHSIASIPFDMDGPALREDAQPAKPFTVAGEHGVLLGQQDGTLEAWVLPVKLLSQLTLEAEMQDYPVPIDVNNMAAQIEVRPDRTVITYAHPGFTVRQIMFSPGGGAWNSGPVILYEFDCLRPTDFTFRFTPELRWMWPERNEGTPDAEWVAHGGQGYYVLHTDYPDLAGAITIPGARPGILAPYQERPQVHPVELRLHIDPERDKGRLYPLLMAAGMNVHDAGNAVLGDSLAQLNANVAAAYAEHAARWKTLLADSTRIVTPNAALDEAFQWATISIEQLKTALRKSDGSEETALVAGYYSSGDSARPGFGWFFGRDALYTLYAVNGFGDFALTRNELEFLIRRQRADGKIMHEYSQTAPAVDWQAFPYMYAAADATPLFLLAVADYVKASGDIGFLEAHRDAVEKAWQFETTHDSDGDGIYDNSQGTGWVESWPGGMPHQEVYLALLDQEASAAMARMEMLLGDATAADAARKRAETVAKTIEAEYYDAQKGCYAFSRNADGTMDRTVTIYPALAWWDPASGKAALTHPQECMEQFVGSALNTDWGTRDVSNEEKIYDGMSYHQGSVWPLFTGWAALAEYRGGQALAGYQLLMENANLTRAQDIGAVTELLSGDFFVPFGRSTSHQLWSSAMVITPALRGLFGIAVDAQAKTIAVNPHLPASWDHAEVLQLALPAGTASLLFTRKDATLEVLLKAPAGWRLVSDAAGAAGKTTRLEFALPELEADLPFDMFEPLPGARTSQLRVLRSEYREHRLMLTVEGIAGSSGTLNLIRRGLFLPKVQSDAGERGVTIGMPDSADTKALPLKLSFPAGTGWKTITVTLTW